jgi:hypothetical protein
LNTRSRTGRPQEGAPADDLRRYARRAGSNPAGRRVGGCCDDPNQTWLIRHSRQFSYERKVFRLFPCPHNCRPDVAKRAKRHHKLRHRFIVGRFVMMNKIIGAECHPDGFAFHSELLCCIARFVLPARNVFDALETLVSEVHQHDILWHRPCCPLKAAAVGRRGKGDRCSRT